MNRLKFTVAGALIASALMSASTVSTAQALEKKPATAALKSAQPNLAIGLATNKPSRALLRSEIQKQAAAKGVKLSPAEIDQAANSAMNKLAAPDKGPLKGIIHIKFKRFTICIAWGRDKGHCN